MTITEEHMLTWLAGLKKAELCDLYCESVIEHGCCYINRGEIQHIHVCPAWDNRTCTCLFNWLENLGNFQESVKRRGDTYGRD
nr:MAG TPA: hypothetical protein [Caudoviricetes sp.]